jgi:ABC-type Fe3+/spermidine/putrescine transport system ATPase subunit
MTDAYLKIDSLNLNLGGFSLKDINLSCARSEYHVLLGPTGSGKSSLMKSVLGFHRPNSGAILFNGRDISNDLPETRNMGYVPQNYSLFPHLDVESNIRFGLRVRNNSRSSDDLKVDKLCSTLNIQHLRHRKIQFLSGGERQKVAIARALAIQPSMILLDEPFSSIDEGAKRNLWMELKQMITEVGITAFHITHNLEEAYTMGEKLSVLINGELLQSGPKDEIFDRPITASVARFLNYRNIFEGIAEDRASGTEIKTDHFSIFVSKKFPHKTKVCFCLRQQDIKVIKKGEDVKESLKRNMIPGQIITLFTMPEYCLMTFRIKGSPMPHDLELKFPRYIIERHNLYEGMETNVAVWEPHIIIFNERD